MGVIQKTDPKGVDKQIDRIQEKLFGLKAPDTSSISWISAPNGYECYPRCYKNETSNSRIIEHFESDDDYKEVFYNDDFSASSFFVINGTIPVTPKGLYKSNISLVCQLNLYECYPMITHRADEEAHREVAIILGKMSDTITVTNLVTRIRDVYDSLQITQLTYDNMHPKHIFKFDLDITYEYTC